MDENILLQHLTIYRNEIWSITNAILDQQDKLLKTETYLRCQDPKIHCLDPNPEPHEIINSILNSASRLQKLFQVANRRDDESESQFEFRKERGKLLRKRFLPRKGGEELFKTKIRNSIEHFDERVDVLMNYLIGNNDSKLYGKCLIYNFTLSSKEIFKPWDLVYPVKVLIANTMEYYMISEDLEQECIDLKKVFAEAKKIQAKTQEYVDKHFRVDASERQGPVGMYLPIIQSDQP